VLPTCRHPHSEHMYSVVELTTAKQIIYLDFFVWWRLKLLFFCIAYLGIGLYWYCNLFLWWQSWIFSIIRLVFSVTSHLSEIILICLFAAQETFLIINVENSCAA